MVNYSLDWIIIPRP